LSALLSLLVVGMATGRRVLRQVEALGEDLVREGTEPEGLRGRVSDTTLDRVLSRLEPEGLDKGVHQSVQRALEKGILRQDRLAAGVVSIDGKAGESTRGQAPCEPSHTTRDEEGQEYWYPLALRAALTSSSACPVLDQMMLEGKQGEATAFPKLLGRVVEKYGKHFKLEEDTASASLRGQAPVVLRWLRLLAYDLLALVRAHLPSFKGRCASYALTQEILYQGLLGLAVLPESLSVLA
jgi:hypothetical protein